MGRLESISTSTFKVKLHINLLYNDVTMTPAFALSAVIIILLKVLVL